MPEKITHEYLRKRAIKWLSRSQRLTVVLSELVTYATETPDAIGWNSWNSTLVECKISRSDFQANAKKPHAQEGMGSGNYRYIFCPVGLVQEEEVTDDWGLLWLHDDDRITIEKDAPFRPTPQTKNEVTMLVSALRRIKMREFLVVLPEPELPHA